MFLSVGLGKRNYLTIFLMHLGNPCPVSAFFDSIIVELIKTGSSRQSRPWYMAQGAEVDAVDIDRNGIGKQSGSSITENGHSRRQIVKRKE